MNKLILAAALLTGCGRDVPVLEPIIDVPPMTSPAYPYDTIDEISIAVARLGEDESIKGSRFEVGSPLVLPEIAFGQDLVVHMKGLSAGQEAAYGRTCAVTVTEDRMPPENEPHLYFAGVPKWGISATPYEPTRSGGYAYTLPDGRAVFLGGQGSNGIERFDPQTGSFVRLDAALGAREKRVFAPLADGRVLVIGGVDGDGDGAALAELIDPIPGVPTAARRQEQDGPRLVDTSAVTLVDDTVLVAGGRVQSAAGQPFVVTDLAWKLRVGDGGLLEPVEELRVTMRTARAEHTATRLGNEPGADVLLIGGRDEAGLPVAGAELYRPFRESFQPLDTATLNVPRWGHTAVRLAGGFVLVIGGFKPDPGGGDPLPVAELELYDPVDHAVRVVGMLPDDVGSSDFAFTELPDGRGLLVGGRGRDGKPVNTVRIVQFDAINGLVNLLGADGLGIARAGHAAAQLCDGTILVTGGTVDPGEHQSERYNPLSDARR